MLIRFIVKNIYSYKNETEFNLFHNKAQGLQHHIIKNEDFEFLRFSAIYGANASGKSNLIKAISFLKSLVVKGEIPRNSDEIKFKLSKENLDSPISFGIEFMVSKQAFFYSITFNEDGILYEYLANSKKNEDIMIFERINEDTGQRIVFFKDYYKSDKDKLFAEILSEKLVQKNTLLITFLGEKYQKEFGSSVNLAFQWFKNDLVIIKPESKAVGLAHLMDKDPELEKFANKYIPNLNTGIFEIEIEKKKFEESLYGNIDASQKREIIEELKDQPGKFSVLTNKNTGEEISVVVENEEILTKRIITKHKDHFGGSTDFNLGIESDGTKRLFDYIPAFYEVINHNKVYIIDEIERSIHPITIKELLTKLALDTSIKGQLIFSTHETNLLDQNILRPDEIWFAQKDVDESTKLYSLSEFKIHHTINIENGYLKGRFGGIPFLTNLKDINW
jgi:AAA15 family ATPase/GTPase